MKNIDRYFKRHHIEPDHILSVYCHGRNTVICLDSGEEVSSSLRMYEVMELLPKQQINIVVESSKVDKIVDLIKKELYTGHIGDGKIFVYHIDNAIRVRTGDEGVDAL